MKCGLVIKTKLTSMPKSILCESFRAVPALFKFPTSSTSALFPLPPILNCYPIQVQLPHHANDCPASIHHGNPTTVLIRMSLTEWQVPWRLHPTTTPAFRDTARSLVDLLFHNQS
ncbi:predicted protein [Lichtheimia corymbifera JMRC:FSU:9682]|uniref:Uncharacterized protein n=1 Tax=Lichtheimia corymbifera JMRC:FSU:9682 TaxID=1263082 RepID=A0A068RVM2_9FUNG|nr:predicted protein [Lichtheimia corymbifera JMRC:FSU:9682]